MAKIQIVAGTSSERREFSWGLFFLLFTALGFLSFSYRYLDDLARGHEGTLARRLLEEGTGVYSVLLLLPLVLRFARIYLFKKKAGYCLRRSISLELSRFLQFIPASWP